MRDIPATPSDMDHTETPAKRVVVMIPTFKRTTQLLACLTGIEHAAGHAGLQVLVLVVDNDPDGSALDLVQSRMPSPAIQGWVYLQESRKGVVWARNAALAHVRGLETRFDAGLWIDDDEVPDLNWLSAMMKVLPEWDVITGRVEKTWDSPCELDEIGAGDARAGHKSGPQQPPLSTSNLCLSARVLYADIWFDSWFNGIGGEDSDFSFRCLGLTDRFYSCPESIVREYQPSGRTTAAYLARRAMFANYVWQELKRRYGRAPLPRSIYLVGSIAMWIFVTAHIPLSRSARLRRQIRRSQLRGAILYWLGAELGTGDY